MPVCIFYRGGSFVLIWGKWRWKASVGNIHAHTNSTKHYTTRLTTLQTQLGLFWSASSAVLMQLNNYWDLYQIIWVSWDGKFSLCNCFVQCWRLFKKRPKNEIQTHISRQAQNPHLLCPNCLTEVETLQKSASLACNRRGTTFKCYVVLSLNVLYSIYVKCLL